jgi:hypothetical protein
MSEFFDIVTLALTGLLDITNQAIGILIAWTILGVPLLFILTTFDFMKTLLQELNIIKDDDDELIESVKEVAQFFDDDLQDLDDIITIRINELATRQKKPISFEQEERIRKNVMKLYDRRKQD